MPRRAAVVLPDAALDLRPDGPLRAAQFTDEGVWAVVDLPAFGFAWVSKEADLGRPPASAAGLSARGRQLRNESIEIEIDAATGGLRSVAGVGEPTARLGQQLVMTGLVDAQGKPVASQMRCERFDVDYGGPALVQATVDRHAWSIRNRAIAWPRSCSGTGYGPAGRSSRSRSRWPILIRHGSSRRPRPTRGRSTWRAAGPGPTPTRCCAGRSFWSPELTEAERPETPDAIDISTRTQRTALLFGGLPYHRKHGSRMLDTLLVAGIGIDAGRSRSGSCSISSIRSTRLRTCITPALVVPIEDGPPPIGATGWLAQVDHKGVAVSHVEFVETTGDGRGWGLIFHLLETAGQAARCRLRLFRNPIVGPPGRLPGRDDRRPVDRRRRGVDRPDAARAGADRGDDGIAALRRREEAGTRALASCENEVFTLRRLQ